MGSSTQLDHRATWNEVCEALAFSSLEAHERKPDWEVRGELEPDARGGVRLIPEELAWLALAREALDSACN